MEQLEFHDYPTDLDLLLNEFPQQIATGDPKRLQRDALSMKDSGGVSAGIVITCVQ